MAKRQGALFESGKNNAENFIGQLVRERSAHTMKLEREKSTHQMRLQKKIARYRANKKPLQTAVSLIIAAANKKDGVEQEDDEGDYYNEVEILAAKRMQAAWRARIARKNGKSTANAVLQMKAVMFGAQAKRAREKLPALPPSLPQQLPYSEVEILAAKKMQAAWRARIARKNHQDEASASASVVLQMKANTFGAQADRARQKQREQAEGEQQPAVTATAGREHQHILPHGLPPNQVITPPRNEVQPTPPRSGKTRVRSQQSTEVVAEKLRIRKANSAHHRDTNAPENMDSLALSSMSSNDAEIFDDVDDNADNDIKADEQVLDSNTARKGKQEDFEDRRRERHDELLSATLTRRDRQRLHSANSDAQSNDGTNESNTKPLTPAAMKDLGDLHGLIAQKSAGSARKLQT